MANLETRLIKRQAIFDLWDRGLNLREIGEDERVGVSRQRVAKILKRKGLRSKSYELKRIKKEEIERGRTIFITFLKQLTLEMAERELGWAYRKALEYDFSRKFEVPNSIPLNKLITLFELYKSARDNGQKLSLEEISDITGINYKSLGIILKRVKEGPLNGSRNRRRNTSKNTKEQIRRSFNLGISAGDVGHFIGVPEYIVSQQWISMMGKGHKPHCIYGNRQLTYHAASQVYQAVDLGFNEKEIHELLGINEKEIPHIIKRRQEIEPVIIKSLAVLYPNRKTDKPYLEDKAT
ncbi:hypothetical protein HYW74_04045 [Candidatus Pacearchaeota archaeon]|nr:hypothetical protein [Candidatus Pacearchaeota archaeon]